ncbi:divergent polysaccharide deacetylase family protein [bacterium]|nr:divergent polysaccharide deacetylase family protein [bacterium]
MSKRRRRRASPLTSLLRGSIFFLILLGFGLFIFITQKAGDSSSIFPAFRQPLGNTRRPSPPRPSPHTTPVNTPPSLNFPQINEPSENEVPLRAQHRKYKYRIAIVIDDVGYDLPLLEEFLKLNIPLTFSILPNLNNSSVSAQLARRYGRTIILHMPMQAEMNLPMDENFITVDLTSPEVSSRIERALQSVPGVVGMSNHMGSLATQNEKIMDAVMSTLAKHNLFFLDSLTTPHSVGQKCARNWGVPYLKRDVFLDNEDDPEYILGQLKELVSIALRKGKAIGIGHLKAKTLEALKLALPYFEEKNVKVVPLNELL